MFEYNQIDVNAVESVELLADDASEYMTFKRRLYDDSDEIPEERRRLTERTETAAYITILDSLLTADLDDVILDIVKLEAKIPEYIDNADELRDGLLRQNQNTDVDVEIGDKTPESREECRHSKNDEYRPGEQHMCCWECADEGSSGPNKFDADDDPGRGCTRYTPRGFKIKRELSKTLAFDDSGPHGWLAERFKESNLDVHDVQSRFERAKDGRSAKVQLAFRAAFPDEDYYYQRAEALLRDINADVAQDAGPGSGGRRFEHEAIDELSDRFQLRDETVFKITFDEDAAPFAYSDFVDDPSEPTFKEADAIIEGDIGPIVVDFFTQRSPKAKRRQVYNYAELYEKATGIEPLAWGITDEARGELLELDTLTASEPEPTSDTDGQVALTDFME
jgi:hypothetical protein